MTTATAPNGAGRLLAERLGVKIIGVEGHDLKCACVSCGSSDAGRIHQDTGCFFCYACQKALNAFDLCKVKLADHKAAIEAMVAVGLFDPPRSNGNGKATTTPPLDDEAAFLEVCRLKRVPSEAWRKFGASPFKGGVGIPMIGPDKTRCSHMHITPGNGKGIYAKGKPTGLFLPGRFPAPGETWLIVEGAKDAGALVGLGYLAAGLPSNHMHPKFAPLFAGCDIIVIPDVDQAGSDGAGKTIENLRPAAKSVRVAALPVLQGDVRDALATAGEGKVREAIEAAKPVGESGDGEGPPRFVNVVTCPEFLALDLKAHFLIRDILVAGQPCVVGGRSKTLKTSIVSDAVVSLGSGSPFLGKFAAQKANVGFWSGESGAVVVRETAVRQAAARGVNLADCSISWGFDLPKLSQKSHLDALADVIGKHKLQVVVVDPLYLSLLSADAAGRSSDLFFMGTVLQPLAELGQDTGCTFILLHHFRKNSQADDTEPAGLEELAQSGVAEWARQWILLQRRSPYQADGHHELWMRAGGSAGHAGLWALDIAEGILDPDTFTGRKWDVVVKPVGDARDEAKRERETRKAADMEKRENEQRDRLKAILARFPKGETERALRTASRLNLDNFSRAVLCLEHDGLGGAMHHRKKRSELSGLEAKIVTPETRVGQVGQVGQQAFCPGCPGKGEVVWDRGTIVEYPVPLTTSHQGRADSGAVSPSGVVPLLPPSVPTKVSTAERSRRAWCQQLALGVLSLQAGPGASFDAEVACVRRRWPVSAAGSEFEARARQLWDKEVTEACAWFRQQAIQFAVH